LREARLEHDVIKVDLEDKPSDFIELYSRANPLPGVRAKVPLLKICEVEDYDEAGSKVLCESLVVSEYIAELQAKLYEGSSSATTDTIGLLLPQGIEDRAVMRVFTEVCSSCFSYFPILRARDESSYESALHKFKSGLYNADIFLRNMGSSSSSSSSDKATGGGGGGDSEGLGSDGPFLFGDQFTLAECNTAPFVQRACMVLPMGIESFSSGHEPISPLDICDELGLDRLKFWMEAVLDRPSVRETGVPQETMKKNMEKMMKKLEGMDIPSEQAK